jgi:hypothetical protein
LLHPLEFNGISRAKPSASWSVEENSEIDSADICERLVGITPIYLQNFVSRGLYGLRSSISPGKVRSQRRLFSQDDVYGIALVWLLFESGLRGDPIARVLNDVAGTRKPDANKAAEALRNSTSDYLLVFRTPRRPSKSIPEKPEQRVEMPTAEALSMFLFLKGPNENDENVLITKETVLIIPVRHKFEDVRKRLEMLFGG